MLVLVSVDLFINLGIAKPFLNSFFVMSNVLNDVHSFPLKKCAQIKGIAWHISSRRK